MMFNSGWYVSLGMPDLHKARRISRRKDSYYYKLTVGVHSQANLWRYYEKVW